MVAKRSLAPADRVALGLRVTPAIKERLDEAANQSGRSLSQEAELRLQQSFERQDMVADSMRLSFGPRLGGLLLLLGQVMTVVGNAVVGGATGEAGQSDRWVQSVHGYKQALEAARILLRAAQPDDRGQDEFDIHKFMELGLAPGVTKYLVKDFAPEAIQNAVEDLVTSAIRGRSNTYAGLDLALVEMMGRDALQSIRRRLNDSPEPKAENQTQPEAPQPNEMMRMHLEMERLNLRIDQLVGSLRLQMFDDIGARKQISPPSESDE